MRSAGKERSMASSGPKIPVLWLRSLPKEDSARQEPSWKRASEPRGVEVSMTREVVEGMGGRLWGAGGGRQPAMDGIWKVLACAGEGERFSCGSHLGHLNEIYRL